MSLATEIASITRKLSLIVGLSPFGFTSAGGSVLGVRVSKSFDSPVPVATITVDAINPAIKRGDRVIIEVGYNGLRQRIFTGYVVRRAHGVESSDIECAGQLYQLARINDLTERDATGTTVKAAIDALFTAAGAPGSFVGIDTSGVPTTFTLGTVTPAILPPGSFMGMLQALMDVEGCMVYENGDGVIVVRVMNGLPAAGAVKSFSTNTMATARIIDGRSREDPDALRTRIHATGATIPAPAGATEQTLTVTATLVGGDLVQPPFLIEQYIDMEWSNSLVDTQAKLDECALRVLGQYARVMRQLPLEIPGDPQIEIGDTVVVQDDYLGVSASKWFVWGLEHAIDGGGYVTNLDLRGGEEGGGEININPIASFTYTIEREVFGTQVYVFITFDASASHDPDGTIANYAWAGNQDAADDPAIDSQTTAHFTIRIDPAAMAGDVDNIIVTLTVTDNDGLTGAISQTININASSSLVQIPAVFAALNNRFSVTPDGGQNWNDQSTNATNVTTVAAAPPDGEHAGIAVFGRTDGKIYRTTDYCQTALTLVLTATDGIIDLAWDPLDSTRVWALTGNCNLYVSTDYGASFTLIVNWRTAMALATIIGRKVAVEADGAVWVYGGTGVTSNGRPFIGRFVNGGIPFGFASAFGGELNADLGSGATALAIVDAANKHDGGGLTIILENYTAYNSGVRPIYHVPDPFVPAGWQRATGLDSGVTFAGRYVVPDDLPGYFHAAFADRDIWHSVNGVAWTVSANVMPVVTTDVIPNRAIWLREDAEGLRTSGTYLIAAQNTGATVGIYKSYDGLQTVALFRPAAGFATWPASALGKDLAVGPAQQTGSNAKIVIYGLLASPTERFIAWRKGGENFTAHIFPTNLDIATVCKLHVITTNLWFGFWPSGNAFNSLAVRTKDGGATWDDLYAAPVAGYAWRCIQRGADGLLWGLVCGNTIFTRAHMKIYWSNDDGGTWTESKDSTAAVGGEEIFHLIPHRLNANRIGAIGRVNENLVTWITNDGGSTWTRHVQNVITKSVADDQHGWMMLDSDRIIGTGWDTTSDKATIWTSDDDGVSWVARKTFDNVTQPNNEFIYGPVGDPLGNRLFVMVEEKSVSPYDIQIWESNNHGQTWTQSAGAALGNGPPVPAADDTYIGGLAYDGARGVLYLFGAGENDATNINQIVSTVGLGWQDVSDALIAALTGHTKYTLSSERTYGIGIIP